LCAICFSLDYVVLAALDFVSSVFAWTLFYLGAFFDDVALTVRDRRLYTARTLLEGSLLAVCISYFGYVLSVVLANFCSVSLDLDGGVVKFVYAAFSVVHSAGQSHTAVAVGLHLLIGFGLVPVFDGNGAIVVLLDLGDMVVVVPDLVSLHIT